MTLRQRVSDGRKQQPTLSWEVERKMLEIPEPAELGPWPLQRWPSWVLLKMFAQRKNPTKDGFRSLWQVCGTLWLVWCEKKLAPGAKCPFWGAEGNSKQTGRSKSFLSARTSQSPSSAPVGIISSENTWQRRNKVCRIPAQNHKADYRKLGLERRDKLNHWHTMSSQFLSS